MNSAERPVTREGRWRLAKFLAAVSGHAARFCGDEPAILGQATNSLRELVAYDDWLDTEFARSDPRYYQQHLLYCDPTRRFSVVSFVWGPGQQTPIHDHTTWGLIGMLRGAEISQAFDIRDGKPHPTIEKRLEPGEVMMVSPTSGDIHQVRNAFADRVSISVHVYGGDIGAIERHVYLIEGGVKSFVSGYSNLYLPNIWGNV